LLENGALSDFLFFKPVLETRSLPRHHALLSEFTNRRSIDKGEIRKK